MYEDEISLKELIIILLNGWKWILGTTVIALTISLIILIGFNSTTYQLALSGTIIKSDVYDTVYGTYSAKTISNDELINLVKNNDYLENVIDPTSVPFTVSTLITDTGAFTITLSSIKPEVLSDTGQRIMDNFDDFINFTLQKNAIEYFKITTQVSLEKSLSQIEQNALLIETLTQKISTLERTIGNDIINPEYSIFSTERANIEYDTIRLNSDIEKLKDNLVILNNYNSQDFTNYSTSVERIDSVKAQLKFSTLNRVEEVKRFNLLLTLSISTILGGMLGVFIVFFLHYWKNN